MTAGSGIIHQEMPNGDQTGPDAWVSLWANLPAALKMMPPRYQEVKVADILDLTDDDGTHVRLVCGRLWGKTGPVEGIAADPTYRPSRTQRFVSWLERKSSQNSGLRTSLCSRNSCRVNAESQA